MHPDKQEGNAIQFMLLRLCDKVYCNSYHICVTALSIYAYYVCVTKFIIILSV